MVSVFILDKVERRIIQQVEVRREEVHVILYFAHTIELFQHIIRRNCFHNQLYTCFSQGIHQRALQGLTDCAAIPVCQSQLQRRKSFLCLLIPYLIRSRNKRFTLFIQVPSGTIQQFRCFIQIHVIGLDFVQRQRFPFFNSFLVFRLFLCGSVLTGFLYRIQNGFVQQQVHPLSHTEIAHSLLAVSVQGFPFHFIPVRRIRDCLSYGQVIQRCPIRIEADKAQAGSRIVGGSLRIIIGSSCL